MISRRRKGASRRGYDVVFYTPWIGSMLSSRKSLPPGGAETQILALAKALAARGVHVAIIAFGEPWELPGKVDGVTIVPRSSYRGGGQLVGKFVETFNIWRSLWRAPSPVIVNRCAGIELGIIAVYARLAGRRLVFSTANMIDFDWKRLVSRRRDLLLYDLGVRLCDAIVVQTEEQVTACEKAFGRRAVLIKSLAILEELQAGEPEAFIWVGRLVSYKNPEAYLELARALPEARFWMVGVPSPDPKSDRELTQKVVADAAEILNLELLPPRTHAELQALMARAVASVNTAEYEGMPNVLLEAWNRGVPALVLTHDPGGVVVAHGLGGFADGSPHKLAVLAREQWERRKNRSQVSERCRAYIAAHHAPEIVAERWIEILSAAESECDAHTPEATVGSACVG